METVGPTHTPCYFLISVSTRENLELCVKYGLAGFPSGAGGAWTFCEIETGDFVSFLYGAKAHNLYRVATKEAISGAEVLPPWKLLTFKESGRTYSFPFRLRLEPVRSFTEPLVRAEFSYVAENLLLRGGYRRTHFQADQTTLQRVSQLGALYEGSLRPLPMPDRRVFSPSFTRNVKLVRPPEVCRFLEPILQTAIRRYLTDESKLESLLTSADLSVVSRKSLEVLGEKALTQGHVDLLLKQRVPLGSSPQVPIEVKIGRAQPKDLSQLRGYMNELGESPVGVLVAGDFAKGTVRGASALDIRLVRYRLSADLKGTPTFDEISDGLILESLHD
jgi:hypothetical protein